VIAVPTGVRVWLAGGVTDMRRGMNGLAPDVARVLAADPYSGAAFVFRGKRGQRPTFCI
jgi:transposase